MRIVQCEQLSPTWWSARRGVPTASAFDRIMTPAKRAYSAQARKYALELVAELADLNPEHFTGHGVYRSTAMTHGVNTEAEARRWYCLERNTDVTQVGLCLTDDLRFGASPDALVGNDGALELKAPMLKTQAEYLDEGVLPTEYKCQCHGELIVTGRSWVDFCSYAPGLPALLIRVVPDDFTKALKDCLEKFWTEFMEIRRKLIPEECAVGDAFEPAMA